MRKINSYLFVISILLLGFLSSEAQINSLRIDYFTDHYLNPIYYNPAFTGEESQAKIGLSGRSIQNSVSDPVSFQGFIHGQIESIKSGVGLMVNYHDFGDVYKRRQMKIGLLYSYTIQAGDKGRFKLGLNSSLLHYNSNFVPNSGGVDVIKTNENFFKFNMDGSVLFLSGNFYMGVTMFHVNEPIFEFYNVGGNNRFEQEAYITLGQAIELNENIRLHPAAILNFNLNQFSNSFNNNQGFIDLSVLAKYQDRFLLGASYKLNQTPFNWGFTAGVKLADKYQIAATYHLKEANYLNRSRVGLTLNYFLPKVEEEGIGEEF